MVPLKNERSRGFVVGEPVTVLLYVGLTAAGIKNVWEIPRCRQRTRNMARQNCNILHATSKIERERERERERATNQSFNK